MMHTIAAACTLLGFAVIAIAQPPLVGTGPGPVDAGRIDPESPALSQPISLSGAELKMIAARFAAYRTHLRAEAVRAADLTRAGIAQTADAVERANDTPEHRIGPIHVGVLAPLSAAVAADVDPAVMAGARGALRARLGREPSRAQVDAELKEMDARIERINHDLFARRAEIARAMRNSGQLPIALERRVLGVAGAAEPVDAAQVERGFQRMVRSLLLDEATASTDTDRRVRPPTTSVPIDRASTPTDRVPVRP